MDEPPRGAPSGGRLVTGSAVRRRSVRAVRSSLAAVKLCVNMAARRDLFILHELENAAIQKTSGIHAAVWLPPFAIANSVQQINLGNVITYTDFSRFVRPTREQPTVKFFDEILRQKRPYRETTLFGAISGGQIKRKRIGVDKNSSVVLTPENVVDYYDQCMRHAEFVAREGLQPHAKASSHRAGRETDIAVLVDPSGEVMFFRKGNHRLGIARAHGINPIPVRIFTVAGAYMERFMPRRDVWRTWELPARLQLVCRTAVERAVEPVDAAR